MSLQQAYLDTWNATDAGHRDELLARHWRDDATYTDPLVTVNGRDQVAATIVAVHDQFPGFVFTAASEPDSHHDQTRFTWGLGPEGEEPVVIGFDVVVTDAEGRIATVLGFLDRVPEQAS